MTNHLINKSACLLITSLIIVFPVFSQTSKPENIDIKIRKAGNTFPVEIIKRITLLPIEFKPDAMINRIAKVQFDGTRYYLLNEIDGSTQNMIMTSKDGKIDQVLNRKGKGPGEYQLILDFNVDPVKKELWIFDGGKQLYSVYSPDLKFLRSFPTNKEFTPGSFLFTPWDSQSIVINSSEIDRKAGKMFNTLSIVKNETAAKMLLNLGEILSDQGGGLFCLQGLADAIDFWPPFSSDIIRINEAGCHPVYHITFDEPTVKPGTLITSSMHPEVFAQSFYESDSYVLIRFMISNKVYLTFYHKKTHQVTTIQNPWNSKTDEGFLFHLLGFVGNKLVLNAINLDLREVISKLDPAGSKLADKNMLDKIDPASQFSNPILVFVEME